MRLISPTSTKESQVVKAKCRPIYVVWSPFQRAACICIHRGGRERRFFYNPAEVWGIAWSRKREKQSQTTPHSERTGIGDCPWRLERAAQWFSFWLCIKFIWGPFPSRRRGSSADWISQNLGWGWGPAWMVLRVSNASNKQPGLRTASKTGNTAEVERSPRPMARVRGPRRTRAGEKCRGGGGITFLGKGLSDYWIRSWVLPCVSKTSWPPGKSCGKQQFVLVLPWREWKTGVTSRDQPGQVGPAWRAAPPGSQGGAGWGAGGLPHTGRWWSSCRPFTCPVKWGVSKAEDLGTSQGLPDRLRLFVFVF